MTSSAPIAAIERIEKALEGVTPGPWLTHEAVLGHKGDVFAPTAKRVTDCHHIARCFAPKPVRPVICELQAIQVKREAVAVSEANAAYIASCSPDVMPGILALARKAEEMERENAELAKAVLEVLDAVRDYLPPDGITDTDCLTRIIGAVDNDSINPLIKKLEHDGAIAARSLTKGESDAQG